MTVSILDRLRQQTWLRTAYRRLRWFGLKHWCPVCESSISKFVSHPADPHQAADALCPVCFRKHPHRRIVTFLKQLARERSDLGPVLHIAPEAEVGSQIRRLFHGDYVSGDIVANVGQLQFDIAELPFPDRHFGLIVCCHVLMMIPRTNVEKAVRECFRVLAPGGLAILENPVKPGATLEMEHLAESERSSVFHCGDVQRILGADEYWPLLQRAGFVIHEQRISTEMEVEKSKLYQPSLHFLERPLTS